MTDQYTKTVLTVIAAALIYLCIVMTAFPAVEAQVQGSKRPGEPTGPADVRIVEWRAPTPVPIVANEPLRVLIERGNGTIDRVVLVGWEDTGSENRTTGQLRRFGTQNPGLPVVPRQP